MSKKSKHGRGRHPHFRKRMKMHQMQQAQSGANLMQPAAGDTPMATTPPSVTPDTSRQVAQAPIHKKSQTTAALPIHYEFIGSDLKRIGILTAIVVVILVVFYVFLK